MAEIQLKGVPAIIAAAVIAAVTLLGSGFRSEEDFTHNEELRNELSNRVSKSDVGDILSGLKEAVTQGVSPGNTKSHQKAQRSTVEILSITGRKRSLTFGTSTDYVLKVVYTLTDPIGNTTKTKTDYFKSTQRTLLGGWTYPDTAIESEYERRFFF